MQTAESTSIIDPLFFCTSCTSVDNFFHTVCVRYRGLVKKSNFSAQTQGLLYINGSYKSQLTGEILHNKQHAQQDRGTYCSGRHYISSISTSYSIHHHSTHYTKAARAVSTKSSDRFILWEYNYTEQDRVWLKPRKL